MCRRPRPARDPLSAGSPSHRLVTLGPVALRDAELLTLLLRGGRSTQLTLAHAEALLGRAGSLRGLAAWSLREIAAVPGIGPQRAAALTAALELGRRLAETRLVPTMPVGRSQDVFAHAHLRLRDLRKERMLALLLDGRHRFLREVLVSEGTLTASLVHPREAFAPAIRDSAAALVFVHNHPSGDPAPSPEDVALTRRLVAVGDLVGIRVLDHVVIGEGRYYSFADAGQIAADRAAL